ncbi:hypothetical protein BCR34DRAFT_495726 [Clohesyomyces aquaticus]|uniref:Copper acquisition factor BIM1-like domain-containing protein n=1 Tax=Clohesyomyces aquaticus TaxID=1231657 RepID=A0A1Y1YLH7_9PLEO|nr:hypothetical protein BCR34DRAFT_495726 [Clohesyomyces aquaticus]
MLLLCARLATSHFVLLDPVSLGFDDENEGVAPCGSFNATDRTNVTNWPVKGAAIGFLTTHTNAVFEFNTALLSTPNNWVPLTKDLNQTGVGQFCEPQIPAREDWKGKNGILQVIQHSPEGLLYQCAAIKFTGGPKAATPSACFNDTGTAAIWVGHHH